MKKEKMLSGRKKGKRERNRFSYGGWEGQQILPSEKVCNDSSRLEQQARPDPRSFVGQDLTIQIPQVAPSTLGHAPCMSKCSVLVLYGRLPGHSSLVRNFAFSSAGMANCHSARVRDIPPALDPAVFYRKCGSWEGPYSLS